MKAGLGLLILFLIVSCSQPEKKYNTWNNYGGSKDNIHYSSLRQIDTSNVNQLQVAWEFHTGDSDRATQIQTNAIVVDGILFGVSPKLKLFALNAATGEKKWIFDPVDTTNIKGIGYFSMNVCRGVTYYSSGENDKRIFYAASSNLYCIDANNGKPVESFGDKGKIDLHNDLGADIKDLYVATTTPGIIYKDMIILGSRVAEEAAAAPGHIRAYDVHTGKLRWIFHTIPQPGEVGYETWDDKDAYKNIGGANAWAGFSLDEEKGILFAPTGSASYDFYGGKRSGQNLFANCVLALDATTGKRIWHFQTVHHDVWDRDLPTAPMVVNIEKDGKKIEAVAQATKSGFIFLFERATGKPVYPIEERQVPTETELNGEKLSPTQPWPTFPKPFARQALTEKDLNTLVPDSSYNDIKARLATYKTGFIFTPPSKQGTIIFPGFDGGAEWGGPAFDPETSIMYVNASELPWVLTMKDVDTTSKKNETNLEAGKRLYAATCMACHGPQMQGGGNFPTLIGVEKKYTVDSFMQLITTGRRMMPALNQLSKEEKKAIGSFVLLLNSEQDKKFTGPPKVENQYYKLPYSSTGYNKFLTKEGYPAVAPPWGTISAINLNSGELIWKNPLGEYPELKEKGILPTGTENYGGPVVTAGGLLFIAASRDAMIRAYNKYNGKLLWEYKLPAPGFATPSVYEVNGKQFLVIACGGGKLKTRSGDAYVAFALPDKK
ncbi:MAG TPA: PQQ-binding-like beta-propeller repeat protein [Chitinophagaceae bacterium]|nr:PQQ-binding-like beta-propeller repeat protein [Chitinophagaceae bacterium]